MKISIFTQMDNVSCLALSVDHIVLENEVGGRCNK